MRLLRKKIAAFATTRLAQLFAVELVGESGRCLGFGARLGQLEIDQPPGGAVASTRFAKFEQELFGADFHGLELHEPGRQSALSWRRRMARSLATRSRLWAST